ncbi:MAG: TolC family protein [Firmicutes bacterium]|nr:TolC family protein [Bacillota bacterium]
MKKHIIIIALILCLSSLLLPGRVAWATDKEITLDYQDIAARVEKYNSTMRISKLSLSEAQSALSTAKQSNREQRKQRDSVEAAIGETKELIVGGTLDETQLKEAQSLLSTLGQLSDSLRSQNTSQLERTIEAISLQNAQSLAQLINGAQQQFIRAWQLQLNIDQQQNKLKQAEAAVNIAKTKLDHGLGTTWALAEAKLQVSIAQTELTAMKNQWQNILTQLENYTGYPQGEIIALGEAPQLDEELLSKLQLLKNIESAVAANFSLKLLSIDRINASSTSAKKKIDIQIEQQQTTVRQNIKQKYDALKEAQAKLELAEAELQQNEQLLKIAENSFKLGKISQNALDMQKAAYTAKKIAQQNAALTVVLELSDYLSKVNGLN